MGNFKGKYMEISRYSNIIIELETLISAGAHVSTLLVGTMPSQMHQSFSDPIFTKVLCHAISLHRLTPKPVDDVELWDMPSACAVARCIIEAHDVLEYIALVEIGDEEREFRLLVWQLHDRHRRLKMARALQSNHSGVHEVSMDAMQLSKRIVAHPVFQKIDAGMKTKIRTGDAPAFLLSQRERNKTNGINHDYYNAATMFLSQYVHTTPMSVHQLMQFKAGTADALRMSSMPIQYSLSFLAQAITRMAETFLKGQTVFSPSQAKALSTWCGIARGGVELSSASR